MARRIENELCLTRDEWRQHITNAEGRCRDLYSSKSQRTVCMAGVGDVQKAMTSEFSGKGLHGRKRRR